VKAITPLITALTLLTAQPVAAQQGEAAGAVFALMDKNEWCPGGSVYLDLQTGSFLLYRRLPRPACADAKMRASVEQGKLGAAELQLVRSAYFKARRAGLRRDHCELVVSNGGPEVLAVTGPAFSATTPEDEGCWSEAAMALHEELFKVFGGRRH
jgi:hypothetical protein